MRRYDPVNALCDRLIDRRASLFSKLVLRAAIRAAVDIVWADGHADPDPDGTESEQLLREALAYVVPKP